MRRESQSIQAKGGCPGEDDGSTEPLAVSKDWPEMPLPCQLTDNLGLSVSTEHLITDLQTNLCLLWLVKQVCGFDWLDFILTHLVDSNIPIKD